MSITTYSELKTAAANWLDRTDLTDRIPEFIALFEARANRTLRAPEMLTKDTAFSIDDQYVDHPTGYLEAVRFTLATSPIVNLEFIAPEQMAEWREGRTASGKPKWYTVVGTQFEFLPTPDSTYTATLLYYAKLTALSDSATTNWLLTSHPDIYLAGTLLSAEPYLKNDERVPLWRQMLGEAMAELRIQNDRKQAGHGPRQRFPVMG